MFSGKSFYFFYYAAFAALIPFLILYYQNLGFSSQQIGILSALFPITMLVSAPFWGVIADKTKRYKTIHVSLIGISILIIIAFSTVQTFQIALSLVAAFAFFVAPIIPLGDTAVLERLGSDKANYGRIRVWGAVGWGISAPLVGILTEYFALTWAFYAYILLMFFCLASSLKLSFAKPSKEKNNSSLRGFLTPAWLFFLSVIFLAGASLAVSNNFVYLYLAELNASGFIVGLALSVATLSELPITFYGSKLLKRFSTRQLLLAALAFLGLRLCLYGFSSTALLVLAIQLLHGFSFSVLWIAGVAYADSFAPEGKNATAQGLFNAIFMGLGSATGLLIGGYFYDALGANTLFLGFGVFCLAATVLLFLASKRITFT